MSKYLPLLSICFFLLCVACNNPISFDDQEFVERHSRILRTEGGTIDFVSSFNSYDEAPDVLVSLEVPPGAVLKETLFEIIRGDFFIYEDLLIESYQEIDTVLLPMTTDPVDTFENYIFRPTVWRAMTGFLPNLLTFEKPVTLRFKYLDPYWNAYPDVNDLDDWYYHYEEPTLYRLLIGADLNGFFPGSVIDQYLFQRRGDWEEVPDYELDEDLGMVTLPIENFYYLYFLASERWRLTRDETVDILFSNGPYEETISWSLQDPASWNTPATGDEAIDYFLDRSQRGFMQEDGLSYYFYYDTFFSDVFSPLGDMYNRVLFGMEGNFTGPGTYALNQDQVSINFVQASNGIFAAIETFNLDPGTTAILEVENYGPVQGFFRGNLSGQFRTSSGEPQQISIDLTLRRTN